ncbi:MAG: RNA polymerase sigma factor [bacterium]|nr:RNA polymerase sigma factor [bacterium]
MSAIGPEFPQVLAAAQEGAEWAWTTLYHSLAGQLAGFARAKGAPEPDDVVGEVLHDVARNIQSFEGTEANFRSWVFTIAHNRLVDQWRKAGKRQHHISPPAGTAASAEHEALQVSTQGPAFRALESLTDAQRTVMLLRTIADLSLEQVAEVMGTNRNSVKALQHRAVRQLRKILGQPVSK